MTIHNEDKTPSLSVNPEHFLNKINEIKQFSENLPKETTLPILTEAEGFLKWFKHDVKVNDINDLTEKIQDRMIEQNKVLLRVIQEFKNVYETFSILNKEYILKIVASVKAAEEANRKAIHGLNEINKSNEVINKSNEELKKHQRKLDSLIGQQALVVNSLKKFKQELEELKHLKNIDTMFEALSHIQEGLNEVEATVDTHQQQLMAISERTKELQLNADLYQKNFEEFKALTEVQFESVEEKINQQEVLVTSLKTTSTENMTSINFLLKEFADYQQKFNEFNEDNDKNLKNLNITMNNNMTNLNESVDNIEQQFLVYKTKMEQDVQVLQEKYDVENKNIVAQFEKEFLNYNKELKELNELVAKLSGKLKLTKIISFSVLGIVLILIIFSFSGVL